AGQDRSDGPGSTRGRSAQVEEKGPGVTVAVRPRAGAGPQVEDDGGLTGNRSRSDDGKPELRRAVQVEDCCAVHGASEGRTLGAGGQGDEVTDGASCQVNGLRT